MTGDLTIKGITRPVMLDVQRYGEVNDERLGHRVLDRQRAYQEDIEAHDRHADEAVRLPAGPDALAVRAARPRSRRHPRVRPARLPGPDAGVGGIASPALRLERAVVRGPRSSLRVEVPTSGFQIFNERRH